MDFFDFIWWWSVILALMVGPFVVGSRNILCWILYLTLCGFLTPLLGIPIYKSIMKY